MKREELKLKRKKIGGLHINGDCAYSIYENRDAAGIYVDYDLIKNWWEFDSSGKVEKTELIGRYNYIADAIYTMAHIYGA